MPSRLDALADCLEAAWLAGGGTSAVSWETGTVERKTHGGRYRIILSRGRGRLIPSTGPGRVTLGTPLVGGEAPRATQKFRREEIIEADLRAPDETELDDLFDRFVDVAWTTLGPNIFEDSGQEYEWYREDSQSGGTWTARSPAIRIYFRARLRALPQPDGMSVPVAQADTTAGMTATGATAPDVVQFTTP